MFNIGVPQLILVVVVALLVFGPAKLLEIGAELGKTIGVFRKVTGAIGDQFKSVTTLEPEDEMRTRLILEQQRKAAAESSSVTVTKEQWDEYMQLKQAAAAPEIAATTSQNGSTDTQS